MNISQAPHGVNLVVETEKTIYIGRFDNVDAQGIVLRDCAVHHVSDNEDPENYIRKTARYGVEVEFKDVIFEAGTIRRVRKLGDVPKIDG